MNVIYVSVCSYYYEESYELIEENFRISNIVSKLFQLLGGIQIKFTVMFFKGNFVIQNFNLGSFLSNTVN